MFLGEFESSIDDKGRVILPARLREAIDGDRDDQAFYATLGADGCIELCTPAEWGRRVEALRKSAFVPEKARRFARTMSSMTERVSADKQGRVRLPQNLIDINSITKLVTVIGNFDVIEVWSRERWDAMKAESLKEFKNDAETLYGQPGV